MMHSMIRVSFIQIPNTKMLKIPSRRMRKGIFEIFYPGYINSVLFFNSKAKALAFSGLPSILLIAMDQLVPV